jgi:hypothetical protein
MSLEALEISGFLAENLGQTGINGLENYASEI